MKLGPPTEVGGPGFMRWPAFYKPYRCTVDDMISGIAERTVYSFFSSTSQTAFFPYPISVCGAYPHLADENQRCRNFLSFFLNARILESRKCPTEPSTSEQSAPGFCHRRSRDRGVTNC